jgi:hypothetical protein
MMNEEKEWEGRVLNERITNGMCCIRFFILSFETMIQKICMYS